MQQIVDYVGKDDVNHTVTARFNSGYDLTSMIVITWKKEASYIVANEFLLVFSKDIVTGKPLTKGVKK